ncbi:hypothetical protein [Streptomyces sp. NPDC002790]|uniref:hypothetical protein n=1 Tax=Streptomyces sp. NPDC002790 TaxID=3154431 RepID=UPI003325FF98
MVTVAGVVVSCGGVAVVAGAARGKSVSGGVASGGVARALPVSMSTCTRWASTHARARSSGFSGGAGGSPSAASSSKFRFSEGAEKRSVDPLSRSPLCGPPSRRSPLACSYQGGGA